MTRSGWPIRLWRDLRSQILVWIVFPITTILLVVTFHGIYSHQRAMRALVEDRDLALAALAAKEVEEDLVGCQSILENVRDHEVILDAQLIDYSPLLRGFSTQLSAFDRGVALLTKSGELLATRPDSTVWAARIQALKPQLEQVTDGESRTILTAFEDSPSDVVAAFMVSGVADEVVLVGVFSLEGCGGAGVLASLGVGGQGILYLVDGDGNIVHHPDKSQVGSNIPTELGIDNAELVEAGAGLYQDSAGRDMILARAPVGQTTWAVIVQEPWGDLLSPIMRYSMIAPIIVLIVAVGAFLIIYLGARQVLQPLEELGRRASKIAWGDFSAARDPVGGISEIEELRVTLNQMADRIRAYQAAMHSYVAAVTRAQEEERLRLGHELHDDTVQSLIAISQGLERAQNDLPPAAEDLREELGTLRELVNSTIDELRRYISDLRPVYLEDLGLIPSLEKLVDDLADGRALDAEFNVIGAPHRLPADVELAVFRIVQEALNNVEQHAQASWVGVKLEFDSDGITVFVEDNGTGFEPPDTPSELGERGHFGLMGMQERAMLLGGWFSIGSKSGQGTKIITYLPV